MFGRLQRHAAFAINLHLDACHPYRVFYPYGLDGVQTFPEALNLDSVDEPESPDRGCRRWVACGVILERAGLVDVAARKLSWRSMEAIVLLEGFEGSNAVSFD